MPVERGNNSILLKRPPFVVALVVTVLVSASTWFYVNRILRAQQIADAALHNRPRGNLSDLYPRWLGARELLIHRRDPYSPEITHEIQQGYYGRPLDPARPDDPKDQQGFAYPVYVVFLLVLVLGWWPMVQGLKLQQLTLLVAGLLAGCGACLAGEWFFFAGGLLAFATIKPQLAWPLVLWLLLWAGSDWRSRRRFVLGFGLMMMLLLGGAEYILPGWQWMFLHAIGQYHQYTQNKSVLVALFGSILGRVFEVGSIVVCARCIWSARREPATSAAFGRAFALVLALTVVVVPMFAPYNQVLLVPAILALVLSEVSAERILPAIRLARGIGALLFAWPWIASLALSAAYIWITPDLRQRLWPLPFYTNFVLPVFVFGLSLLDTWTNAARNLRDNAPAE